MVDGVTEFDEAVIELGIDVTHGVTLDDLARILVHTGAMLDVDEAHEFICDQFNSGAVPLPMSEH